MFKDFFGQRNNFNRAGFDDDFGDFGFKNDNFTGFGMGNAHKQFEEIHKRFANMHKGMGRGFTGGFDDDPFNDDFFNDFGINETMHNKEDRNKSEIIISNYKQIIKKAHKKRRRLLLQVSAKTTASGWLPCSKFCHPSILSTMLSVAFALQTLMVGCDWPYYRTCDNPVTVKLFMIIYSGAVTGLSP